MSKFKVCFLFPAEEEGLFLVDNMPCSSSPRRKDLTKMEDSNMSQTICLFRKYLLTRAQQHNNGKTNMEESQVIKRRTSAHPLLPPKFGCNFNRPPSLLEQELLPRLRYISYDLCDIKFEFNFC